MGMGRDVHTWGELYVGRKVLTHSLSHSFFPLDLKCQFFCRHSGTFKKDAADYLDAFIVVFSEDINHFESQFYPGFT